MLFRASVAVVVALAAAGTAFAALRVTVVPTRTACVGRAVDVYFWPHGHPAVPLLKFPAYAPPHVEIYRAGSVANSAQLGYFDTKAAGFAKSCHTVQPASAKPVGNAGTTTRTQKITCRIAGSTTEFSVIKLPNGGVAVFFLDGHTPKTVLQITMTASAPVAKWGPQCSGKAIPGVS